MTSTDELRQQFFSSIIPTYADYGHDNEMCSIMRGGFNFEMTTTSLNNKPHGFTHSLNHS